MSNEVLTEKNIDESWFQVGSLFMYAIVKGVNDSGELWCKDGNEAEVVFQVEGAPDWAVFNKIEDIDEVITKLNQLKQRVVRHNLAVTEGLS